MKRPTKPRKPKPIMAHLGSAAFERDNGYVCVTEVTRVAIEKAAKTFGLAKEEIQPEWCYVRGKHLYFNPERLPDEALEELVDDSITADVKRYRKKWDRYQTKLKQYHINMEIYRAWKLKDKKDKLIEQMKSLEKELANLQGRVSEVDQSIEKAVHG